MSGISNVLKNGWHPDKNQDFKKQVTGIWKKDDNDYEAHANHVSRPLSSLRDPASFGPPPRHVALGGGATPSGNAATTHSASASSAHHAPLTPTRPSLPARPGAAAASDDDEKPPSPQPYRMDTTGLNTSHLPPPPTRKDGSGISRSPPARSPAPPASGPTARPSRPPGLPPRLPPRTTPSPNPPSYHSATGTSAHPPPPPRPSDTGGDTYINQDAVNRLGRAGISVPGLGIGPAAHGAQGQQQPTALSAIHSLAASSSAAPASLSASATPSPRQPSPAREQTANHASPAAQLGELQARFAKMNAGTNAGASAGTSRTPSRSPARPPVENNPGHTSSAAASLVAGKKKPPPPPAKKPGLAAAAGKPHPGGASSHHDDDDAPPPIPMATRPQGW